MTGSTLVVMLLASACGRAVAGAVVLLQTRADIIPSSVAEKFAYVKDYTDEDRLSDLFTADADLEGIYINSHPPNGRASELLATMRQGNNSEGGTPCVPAPKWISEKMLHETFDEEAIKSMVDMGRLESRSNPDEPTKAQFYVHPAKDWISEQALRQKFSDEAIEEMKKTGRIETRQNPDCSGRRQFFVRTSPAVSTGKDVRKEIETVQMEENKSVRDPWVAKANATSSNATLQPSGDVKENPERVIDFPEEVKEPCEAGKKWINNQTLHEKYDIEAIKSMIDMGTLESRSNPDEPNKTQFYVHPAKDWISQEALRQKFSDEAIEEMNKSGRIETRQNPDCNDRRQFVVHDPEEIAEKKEVEEFEEQKEQDVSHQREEQQPSEQMVKASVNHRVKHGSKHSAKKRSGAADGELAKEKSHKEKKRMETTQEVDKELAKEKSHKEEKVLETAQEVESVSDEIQDEQKEENPPKAGFMRTLFVKLQKVIGAIMAFFHLA